MGTRVCSSIKGKLGQLPLYPVLSRWIRRLISGIQRSNFPLLNLGQKRLRRVSALTPVKPNLSKFRSFLLFSLEILNLTISPLFWSGSAKETSSWNCSLHAVGLLLELPVLAVRAALPVGLGPPCSKRKHHYLVLDAYDSLSGSNPTS